MGPKGPYRRSMAGATFIAFWKRGICQLENRPIGEGGNGRDNKRAMGNSPSLAFLPAPSGSSPLLARELVGAIHNALPLRTERHMLSAYFTFLGGRKLATASFLSLHLPPPPPPLPPSFPHGDKWPPVLTLLSLSPLSSSSFSAIWSPARNP